MNNGPEPTTGYCKSLIVLPTFLLTFVVSAASFAGGEPVSPGQLFPGDVLNIQAPNSDGWYLLKSDSSGWAIGRSGATRKSSYTAMVLAFPVESDLSGEDLVALVTQKYEAESQSARFNLLESTVELTEEREYLCARTKWLGEDTEAKVSLFKRETQLMQTTALYCKHPTVDGLGFAIMFSHRGKNIADEFERLADDFIIGVDVPAQE